MIEHHDLSYTIYLKIREMILRGKLPPGKKLLQEQLAKELGVSRTPLLKAYKMLEYDYFVESIPRRGMFVRKMAEKDMIDMYDVREGIESIAVRLVAERINPGQLQILEAAWKPFTRKNKINLAAYRKADEKFHALLLEFSQNKFLQKTYSNSLIEARVVQMGLQRPPEETLQEHLDLIKAIAEGKADEAEKLIKLHIRRSKALIEKNFKTGY
jgi:DNA-binding GntR family transcriptional regulator